MAASTTSTLQVKFPSSDHIDSSASKDLHCASQEITSLVVPDHTLNMIPSQHKAAQKVTLSVDDETSQNISQRPHHEAPEVTLQEEGATSLNYYATATVSTGAIPRVTREVSPSKGSGPMLSGTTEVPSYMGATLPSLKASVPVDPHVDIQRIEAPRQPTPENPRIFSFLEQALQSTLAYVKDIPSVTSSALIRAYNLCKIPFNSPAPELLSLLGRSDPLTGQLALIICNRLRADATNMSPMATLQIVLSIIQILLISISLTVLMTTHRNTVLITLQISALVTAGLQLVTSFKIKNDLHKAIPIEDIVKAVYGLSDSVGNSEGISKEESRYADIVTTLGNSFGLLPAQYNTRPEGDDLTSSVLPPGSKWKAYEIVLKKKLKNLAVKYPVLATYSLMGSRAKPEDLNDHLYRVFAQFRAFDSYTTDEMLAYQPNLTQDPRPFLRELCHHIYKDTDLWLGAEPWPVSDSEYEILSTGEPAFVRQSAYDISNGVVKGLAVLMGAICLVSGKDMKIFSKFSLNLLSLPKLYNDATTIVWSFASEASAFLYHIFGFDLLHLQAKKLRVTSLLDTIRPLHAMNAENLHAIPGIKKSLNALLLDGEKLLKDTPTGLDKEETATLRKVLDNFARFISSLPDKTPFTFRQIPVGVYLHGHAGSGKTHFALHYLADKLQAERNFTPPCPLERDANGHWGALPEGQQDFFIMDEAAAKKDDPVITDLSRMISEGKYNPAGAFIKEQRS